MYLGMSVSTACDSGRVSCWSHPGRDDRHVWPRTDLAADNGNTTAGSRGQEA